MYFNVQVYKPTSYHNLVRWNKYKYVTFHVRDLYKNTFKRQKNVCKLHVHPDAISFYK